MTGRVALTFDDGPDPAWTPRVLDALAEANARATFFVVAPLAERHPFLLRRAVEEGHQIGLHCARHARHDRVSAAEILADAEDGLRALGRLGHRIRDWRTPWGVVTSDTVDVASRLDLRLVGWTADSEDWRGDEARTMLKRVESRTGDGAIVLMHDAAGPGAMRDGCEQTVRLVAPLVERVRWRGLEPATLGEIAPPIPDRNPGFVSSV